MLQFLCEKLLQQRDAITFSEQGNYNLKQRGTTDVLRATSGHKNTCNQAHEIIC
jgi:hypothetical protein